MSPVALAARFDQLQPVGTGGVRSGPGDSSVSGSSDALTGHPASRGGGGVKKKKKSGGDRVLLPHHDPPGASPRLCDVSAARTPEGAEAAPCAPGPLERSCTCGTVVIAGGGETWLQRNGAFFIFYRVFILSCYLRYGLGQS